MMSYRRTGLDNDLRQFAELPVYPVAQIVAPTLVLHGTADKNVPFEHAAYASKFIPGARLVAVRGADHSLYITHKEKIWPAMSKFFKVTRPPEDEASTM
jgi:pimeloyl-ACP methyl ester carboxylesterase